MQTALRRSKALLSLLHPTSLLPSGATYASEGLAARLLSLVTDRAHSSNIRDRPIVVQQSLLNWWSGNLAHRSFAAFATTEAAQEAEINPLLQTPGPPRGVRDEQGSASSSTGRLSPRERDPKTAQAVQRAIPISPKKLALWTDLMRRKHLDDAIIQCQMSPKKAARICLKVLRSAQANAVNNHGLDGSRLSVDLIHVGQGSHLKKTWPHGRGRSGIRRLYRSHLTVVLRESEVPRFSQFQMPVLERQRRFV
ncbi:g9794 [Coccomyxa elongata]